MTSKREAAGLDSASLSQPPALKESVRNYLTGAMSRRAFVASVAGLGIGTATAGRIATAVAEPTIPATPVAEPADPAALVSVGVSETIEGRGGDVYLAQLRRCGVEFVFTNPSSGSGPIFDAMLDRKDMHVIMCPHEGPLTAMADGYAKASGKVPFVTLSRAGFPNTLVNMFNALHDRTPMIVATEQVPTARRGGGGLQEVDDLIGAAAPFTRWRWETRRVESLAPDIRRAFKFALTPPMGPVFLSVPEEMLFAPVAAEVVDLSRFTLSDVVRVDQGQVEEVAERLARAESPLLYVGDDVFLSNAGDAVVALAELASLPTVDAHAHFHWTSNFPTDHPLYLGEYQTGMRFPKDVDLVLNLGGALPVPGALPHGADLIEVRWDIEGMGRVYPGSFRAAANVRLFAEDLAEALRRRVAPATFRAWREGRGKATERTARGLRQSLEMVAQARWADSPLSAERIGKEFSQHLDTDAILVAELDGGEAAPRYFTYGKEKMTYLATTGTGLGWAVGAAAGVKLAQPHRQVVAMCGDGTFLFGGSQGLWSMARYNIPVIIVVFNNRSYDNERRRIWTRESRQAEAGRDMTCYLGDPDVDFTHLARAYGVDGVKVEEPSELTAAIRRAIEVTRQGQPFLIDVHVSRRGPGKDLTWYPAYSVADRAKTSPQS